jgi:toxin HigB-1
VIKSYRSKALKRLVERGDPSGVNPNHLLKLRLILATLANATRLADIDPHGALGLHPLKGAMAGRYAVSVSGNWRVVFRFEGGDVLEVDYLDYH